MFRKLRTILLAGLLGAGLIVGYKPMTSHAATGARITINYNSGTAGIGNASQTYTEGTTKYLKSPSDLGWTYAGHSFQGWKDEDGTFYSGGEGISDWSTGEAAIPATGDAAAVPAVLPNPYVSGNTTPGAEAASVTLTAQWSTDTYTVNFSGSGASGAMASLECNYGQTYYLPSNAFTAPDGYKFGGWATTQGGAAAYQNLGSFKDIGDTTMYAVWVPITYYVEFNGAGGTGAMTKLTLSYGEEFTIPSCGFVKEDGKFLNWNTSLGGYGTTYVVGQTASNLTTKDGTTVNLYAVWTGNVTITWNCNGGTVDKVSVLTTTHVSGDPVGTMPVPSRSGCSFEGWYTSPSGGTRLTEDTEVNKTATYYAQWDSNFYYVKFNGNGATEGKMDKQLMIYGVEEDLDANEFKRTGYAFKNWNTKANGSGDSYDNEEDVKNLTSTDGGTVTLYAQWKAESYTIIFYGNGSTSGYMENQVANIGVTFALNRNNYQRLGYNFNGWNSRADGSGASYQDGQSVTDLTTATGTKAASGSIVALYAQWVAPNGTVPVATAAGSITTAAGGGGGGSGAGQIQTGSIDPFMYIIGIITCFGTAAVIWYKKFRFIKLKPITVKR